MAQMKIRFPKSSLTFSWHGLFLRFCAIGQQRQEFTATAESSYKVTGLMEADRQSTPPPFNAETFRVSSSLFPNIEFSEEIVVSTATVGLLVVSSRLKMNRPFGWSSHKSSGFCC